MQIFKDKTPSVMRISLCLSGTVAATDYFVNFDRAVHFNKSVMLDCCEISLFYSHNKETLNEIC